MLKTKNVGKPNLPSNRAKATVIPVRVNAEDFKLFEEVAKESGHKTLAGWIRDTLRTGAYRKTAY